MPRAHFDHVRNWVFDLDNTLYPPRMRLFDQMEVLMDRFVMRELGVDADEAHRLRRAYWKTYGTTLAGLIKEHGVIPEHYLEEVHDIDLSVLAPDPQLRDLIAALPGRKFVYTNGSRAHGQKVTEARGLSGIFDGIYGIEDAGFAPKPRRDAFERVFNTAGIDPEHASMFDDDQRNLRVPHEIGMRTVLVGEEQVDDHIHHHTDDLNRFLAQLVALATDEPQA